MSNLRRYDAFVKTRPDMRSRSAVGGIITLVATTTALLLFLGQMIVYIMGNPQHSLTLASSQHVPLRPLNLTPLQAKVMDRLHSIPLQVKITFPHLACDRLDVHHDGASLNEKELSKLHPGHSLVLRPPTAAELFAISSRGSDRLRPKEACTLDGQMRIPLVSGSLVVAEVTSILAIRRLDGNEANFQKAMGQFNCTHYIHHVRFGDPFPYAHDHPLEGRYNFIENNFGGMALEQIEVKLVPTHTPSRLFSSALLLGGTVWSATPHYQMSVTDHQVQPAALVAHGVPQLPGLLIAYDFSPIAVRHHGGRDHILVFFSSLVSIVGGVFVTVGLLTSCLVHSAKAVAKKVD